MSALSILVLSEVDVRGLLNVVAYEGVSHPEVERYSELFTLSSDQVE